MATEEGEEEMARKVRPINAEQKWCSPRQAAQVLGVSESLVYEAANENRIPHRKIGTRIIIPLDWVNRIEEVS